MVQLTSRQRIDALWSNTLGVDELQFHTPGVQVFPNPPQRSIWRGIYVLVFDKSACVLTPPDLLETVSPAVESDLIRGVADHLKGNTAPRRIRLDQSHPDSFAERQVAVTAGANGR
jgi:hypothetical protein